MEDGHGGEMAEMPGMASQEEMDALADASGDAFEERWLQMMVAHHEGAIEMAEAEIADGGSTTLSSSPADLCLQADEIERMEQLLG